jgi:cell division protein FtsW
MARASKHPDYILLIIVGFLLVLGMIILASVSAAYSIKKFGNTYYFLKHQIIFGLMPGLILGLIAYKTNLSFLKKISPILLIFSLILMLLVFLPMIGSKGDSGITAARWIGFQSYSFQPSELLKLSFILYLASWLSSRMEKEKGFGKTFIAFLTVVAVITAILYFQSNVSTLGIIVLTGLIMYFSSETPLWQSISMTLLGGGALIVLIHSALYRLNRLLVFFNPDKDPMGVGYQIKQALIAIGSGNISGVGLGMSIQKFGFLPQTISDSIFAVFAEETGFIGAVALILLFLLFAWRGLTVSQRSQDNFSRLTALGITFWIITQAFVNIGAMIGVLPLTGVPLPFVSYGGSAFILELIGIGILLNISNNT